MKLFGEKKTIEEPVAPKPADKEILVDIKDGHFWSFAEKGTSLLLHRIDNTGKMVLINHAA